MAISLYELFVKLTADPSGYKRGMKEAGQATETFGATAATVGARLAGALGLSAIGAGALAAAQKFEEAGFIIRRATGATGEKLADLEKTFTALYKTSARSSEDIATALSKINVETKTVGKALETLTAYNLKYAKVMGQDVTAAVESTQKVFKQFGIEARDQADAMDLLYRIHQATGISANKLTESMSAAGPVLREYGYSFKEIAILAGNFEEKGRDVASVSMAMARAMKTFSEAGKEPRKALEDLLARMSADPINAYAMALKEIGAKGGAAVVLADAVKAAAFQTKQLTHEVDANTDSVKKAADATVKFSDKLKIYLHQIESAIQPHKDLLIAVGLIGPGVVALAAKLPVLALGWAGITLAILAASKALGDWMKLKGIIPEEGLPVGSFGGVITPEFKRKIPAWVGPIEETGAGLNRGNITGGGAGEFLKAITDARSLLGLEDLRKKLDAATAAYKLLKDSGKLTTGELAAATAELNAINDRLQDSIYGVNAAELKGIALAEKQKEIVDSVIASVKERIKAQGGYIEILGLSVPVIDRLNSLMQTYAYSIQLAANAYRALSFEQAGLEIKGPKLPNVGEGPIDLISDPNSSLNLRRAAEAASIRAQEMRDKWQAGQATQMDWEREQAKATEAEKRAIGVTVIHKEKISEMGREWKKAYDNMRKGMADVLWDGGKVWENFGDKAMKVLKELAKGITEVLIGKALKSLGAALMDMSGLFKSIGGWLGVGSSAATTATKGAGAGAGGAGGVGGAVGAGASGAMGIIGAAASVGTMISSIIGNFQSAKMETTLNAIEHSTRYSMMYLGDRADGGILGILFRINEVLSWGPGVKAIEDLRNKFVDWAGAGGTVSGGGGRGNATFQFYNCSFSGTSETAVSAMMDAAFRKLALAQG